MNQDQLYSTKLLEALTTTVDEAAIDSDNIKRVEIDYKNDEIFIQFKDDSYLKLRVKPDGWSAE